MEGLKTASRIRLVMVNLDGLDAVRLARFTLSKNQKGEGPAFALPSSAQGAYLLMSSVA